MAALQARLTLRATVIRDGRAQDVPVRDVVRGDVVELAAGDIVPADGRLLAANHLYVDESSLTGESAAALKAPAEARPEDAPGTGSHGPGDGPGGSGGVPEPARAAGPADAAGGPATARALSTADAPASHATASATRSCSSGPASSAAPAAH